MSDRYERGMQVRREVMGNAHVDRTKKNTTAEDMPFQDLVTASAWGTVWASDAITRRERSMLTLALLAATGNFDEIEMHVRAAQKTGASKTDIMEAFQHVAIYAGLPKANHAIRIAKRVWETHGDTDR